MEIVNIGLQWAQAHAELLAGLAAGFSGGSAAMAAALNPVACASGVWAAVKKVPFVLPFVKAHRDDIKRFADAFLAELFHDIDEDLAETSKGPGIPPARPHNDMTTSQGTVKVVIKEAPPVAPGP